MELLGSLPPKFAFLIVDNVVDVDLSHAIHFSLDKGYYFSKSLAKIAKVYYLSKTANNYGKKTGDINFIPYSTLDMAFISKIDYIIFTREAMVSSILVQVPFFKTLILSKNRPKICVRCDNTLWFTAKDIKKAWGSIFNVKSTTPNITAFILEHIDFIGAQNTSFKADAIKQKVPEHKIVISSMGIDTHATDAIDFDNMPTPYNVNHNYCVSKLNSWEDNKAFYPDYYIKNPSLIHELNKPKKIVIYTGRIKTNKGRILNNLSNIMKLLGNDYELHIFPGSFYTIDESTGIVTTHSAKNANSLHHLATVSFKDSKNVIIHNPYIHSDKYKWLYHADCGIDFSFTRPDPKAVSSSAHAKLLEYCEMGLPIVCEEHIQNLYLLKQCGNSTILPFNASDECYAKAIKDIINNKKIDRKKSAAVCRELESWDRVACSYVDQLIAARNN